MTRRWQHRERLAWIVATGAGVGLLRPAPATWGTIVGFAYFYLLAKLPLLSFGILVVAGLALGVWSAGHSERLLGRKDPREVVIDEIACTPLALWPMLILTAPPIWVWGAVFIAHRIFDIIKPFPARQLERAPGGWGVMLDDFVASAYAGLLFFCVSWPFS